MYQSSHFHQATPLALSLISDTVCNPAFLEEEIESQREAARYEIREVGAKPEMIIPEILHEVAYDHKSLGNPLLCPEERVDLIDQKTLRGFMKEWYRPERMVIAGAGMQHEELVKLVEKHFSSIPYIPPPQPTSSRSNNAQMPSQFIPPSQPPAFYKSWTRAASSYLYPPSTNSPHAAPPTSSFLNPRSTYTGGHKYMHNPTSEFNHLYLAFEGVGIHDDDVYALATMQVLLGGGGSFSAGQFCHYSPLYVANTCLFRWSWKGNVLAFVHPHPESLSSSRPLCFIPPYLHRLLPLWSLCDLRASCTKRTRKQPLSNLPTSCASALPPAIHTNPQNRVAPCEEPTQV